MSLLLKINNNFIYNKNPNYKIYFKTITKN